MAGTCRRALSPVVIVRNSPSRLIRESNLYTGQARNSMLMETLQPLFGNQLFLLQCSNGAEIASKPAASSQPRNDDVRVF